VKMKSNELLDKSVEELKADLGVELKQQFKLRMQLSTGQLEQSHLVMQTRRNIARIKTAITQKAGE
jgi:large subunit ribosomal protein L29